MRPVIQSRVSDDATVHHTLLIADDSRTARELLRSTVEREKLFATIIESHDGADALRQMGAESPSLVACDLEMPGFDGRWLLKARARIERLKHIPIIVISATTDLAEKAEILDLGAADFITKPFHEKELVARIRLQQRLLSLQQDLRASHARLESLASSDSLTGLWNRRQLGIILSREIERADRYLEPLSIVMVDIDHFKSVNDRFGHDAGDAVLSGVGRLLSATVRTTDFVARYGGEEMTLVLPHTTEAGALILSHRILNALRTAVHAFGDSGTTVTASLGIVAYPENGERLTDLQLLKRADTALFESKRLGRDRVTAWKPGMTQSV